MASILNNIGSLQATRNLANSQAGLNKTINRLSTGLRINRAQDDAAGLQISNNLRADVKILNQARRNANDGLGRLAVQDLVSEEATNLLTRAAELAEQAASGTTTSAGRTALNAEYTEIKEALNALDSDAKFDGQNLFGSAFDIRVGENTSESISVGSIDIDAGSLNVTGNLNTSGSAGEALTSITAAIQTVSAARGTIGAKSQRLQTIVNSLGIQSENLTAAESQIRDADVASEVVNLTKFQILSQSGVSALAQANQSAQSVLSLLG
ncbi:MAG: flagellin [Acidobacteriota bacterium]|nr:flagellin [Acidobacteriota bacterium]